MTALNEPVPRFVQIAVSCDAGVDHLVLENIYALDETGCVWTYLSEEIAKEAPHWYPLSMMRAPRVRTDNLLLLGALCTEWPQIVEYAAKERRLIGEALRFTRPIRATQGNVVLLEVRDAEVNLEGLSRARTIIEKAITNVLECQPVHVEYQPV